MNKLFWLSECHFLSWKEHLMPNSLVFANYYCIIVQLFFIVITEYLEWYVQLVFWVICWQELYSSVLVPFEQFFVW